MTALTFLPLAAPAAPTAGAARGRSAPDGFRDALAAHRPTGGTHARGAHGEVPDEDRPADAGPDLQAPVPLASWLTGAVAPTTVAADTAAVVAAPGNGPLDEDGATVTPTGGDAWPGTTAAVTGDGGHDTLTTTVTVDDAAPAVGVPATTTDVPTEGSDAPAGLAPVDATVPVPAPAPGAETGTGGTERTARAVPGTPVTPAAAATPATESAPGSPAEPAAPAAPAGVVRDRTEAHPRAVVDGVATRTDGVAVATAARHAEQVPAPSGPVTPSSAAQRVLDLVAQLEDAPPPRVVVIETGEIRVRIGVDAGTVRLTVLGPLGETGEEILREAADALEAGGYGTELDRGTADGGGRDGRPRDEDPTRPTAAATARPSARPRAGLQL